MTSDIHEQLKQVLKTNDQGNFTVPAGDLYPHQWLWDSCFISIGLRHLDPERAMTELESLVAGQWANGMLPHIIFSKDRKHRKEHNLWQSWLSPHAPNGLMTSGLTQPPMLAQAILLVGEKLSLPDRRSWYKKMYPYLVKYHAWMYKERDLYGEGLISLIHPYESGLDNSPPWIIEIRAYAWPWWLKAAEILKLDIAANLVRRDTKHVPPGQRMSNLEVIAYWSLLRKLRNNSYDSKRILAKPKIAIEDLAFNCIFIKANDCLVQIAESIGETIPETVVAKMNKSKEALELLWDEDTGQYYGCSLLSKDLVREPTIATLLPLYAGCISKERAEHLVSLLKKRSQFKTSYPIPSVPLSSDYFDDLKYWQGPSWVNMNWLIIKGLTHYGFKDEAHKLKDQTIKMVAKHGPSEYFSPISGEPAGANSFSWTAALTIDLLKN